MSTLEVVAARKRFIDIPKPRPRSRPQGRLRHHRQRQHAREGFLRRRQGAAITAARRDAQEAKAKVEVLLTKMKTMEATLSRVAAMLPSLERLQRRESAAAAKIQAVFKGYATRKTVREVQVAAHQNFFNAFQRARVAVKLQAVVQQLQQQRREDAAAIKIQAAFRGYAKRKKFHEAGMKLAQNFQGAVQNFQARLLLRHFFDGWWWVKINWQYDYCDICMEAHDMECWFHQYHYNGAPLPPEKQWMLRGGEC